MGTLVRRMAFHAGGRETFMNSQANGLAPDTNSWRDGDVSLPLRTGSLPDSSGAAGVHREMATTSVNERQLLLAIRHAAHLRESLLPREINGCNGYPAERYCSLAPGLEIADFRLVKELGSGAFAKVFLAFHQSMQRLVAIKFSRRPSNEPKLLSSLSHPHIVHVYHYDDQCLLEEGVYVLFMEYVPGVDLKQLLQDAATVPMERRSGAWLAGYLSQIAPDSAWPERRVLPPRLANATWAEVVAWISARIADALAYAHRQDVLHRDIKPANVLLRIDGRPTLVDFNVGFGEHVFVRRPEDCFGGSRPYMAPEQRNAFDCRGDVAAVDGRCDIYSLGVLLYELLTGSLPNAEGRADSTTLNTIDFERELVATERVVGMRSAGGLTTCPVGLRDIVTRCLATDVLDRPQSAEFVARRLQICSSRELHDYVFAPSESWAATVSRHPLLALVAVVLAPNVFFAVLNIAFVDRYVSGFYRDVPPHWPVAFGYFTFQKIVVNAIVFPLGLWVVARAARPLVRVLSACCGREPGSQRTGGGIDRTARSLAIRGAPGLPCLARGVWFLGRNGLHFPGLESLGKKALYVGGALATGFRYLFDDAGHLWVVGVCAFGARNQLRIDAVAAGRVGSRRLRPPRKVP